MAQDTATIVGTVTDSTGAIIPNVKITVTNPDKGVNRTTVSDSVGAYRVGPLPIGTFSVTAELAGFQRLVQTGVTLSIGQVQRVDLEMKVGTTNQEITVSGNVVKVQTDDAVISSVVTANEIAAINLDGRSFTSLATLVPGATTLNSFTPTTPGSTVAAIAFSGTRQEFADWNDDGGNLFNWNAAGNFHGTPSIDSIGEFQTSTSSYGADVGIRSGAVINMTTKAGTKDFHGDAYDYIRNQIWDSNPWFTNQELWSGLNAAQYCGGNPAGPCNAPKAILKWNDFGYTFGGPFYIPGKYNSDKSKTFFFYSQEFRRIRQGASITSQAPTARMRKGDFSECDSTSANYNSAISGCVVPKDPATGLLYTREGNGLVPVSSQAADLLNTWVPLPNNGPTGWIDSPGLATNFQQQLFRVDQNVGDKTRIYVRYIHERYGDIVTPTLNRTASYDSIETFTGNPIYNAVVNVTNTFSPTLVNSLMVHYDHRGGAYQGNYDLPGPGWPASVLIKPSDWSMQYIFPQNATASTYLPGFTVSGGGLSFAEDAGANPSLGREFSGEIADNLVKTWRNHTIKTGALYFQGGTASDLYNYAISSTATAQGELVFSTSSTLTTGNGLADMDLGRIASYSESSATANGAPIGGYLGGRYQYWGIEPYIQDDWRVSRRLTINIGLRAYYFSLWEDKSRVPLISAFAANQYLPADEAPLNAAGQLIPNATTGQIYTWEKYGNGLVPCTGQAAGIPHGCQYDPGLEWAPRFGFAYQPFHNPRTVIRGGYGMYWDFTGNSPNPKTLNGNVPVYWVSTASNINGYSGITPGLYGSTTFTNVDPHQQWPLTQQFSLGFQHEFAGNNRFSLSYVGNITIHTSTGRNQNMVPVNSTTVNVPALAGTTDCDSSGNCNVQASLINQKHSSYFFVPYEGYTTISMQQDTAQSNYNALQAEWRHSVGRGVTLEGAYTYSHLIDNGSSYGADPNVDDSNLHRYYATSSLNRTQVLQLSYVYDLPFLKNNPNHYIKNAFGGWEVTGITSFWTGTPINITCSVSGFGTGIGGSSMCNSLAPVKVAKGIDNNPEFGPIKQWYNPADIGQLQASQLNASGQSGMFGYMGLNALTGPGRNNWDLALLKEFTTPWIKGEKSTLQFRWETYNTFNHPQWQGVSGGCDSATPEGNPCNYTVTGGKTYNLGRGDVTSAWSPRIMQFALKLIF
jgi:hypothetical protein